MPENPTVEDDPTATTAAAKGDEGGFSPHSTTTTTTSSTPTGSSSKRNKAAAVAAAAMMTTTVLEQDTPPGSSESSPEMTMLTSTLPLKQCLAAVVKLSAGVSRQHAERTLHLTADLLTGLIEPDEFQRLVSDLIRLPIRPLLQPILAEKQITWLRKEIAQLARHRQLTTTHYVREHVKDLLSLSSDCDDEGDNSSAAEDQETAVPLIWRRKEKIQEDDDQEEDEEQQLQLLKRGDTAAPVLVAPTATSRKRRASASVAEKGRLASVVEAADLSMGTPKRAHHHHHQASSVAAMETTRKNLSVSSSSVWMPPKVVVGQQLSMPSAAASQQQQQQQQHQQQSSSSSSLGGLMKTTPPPFHQSDEEWANIHTMLNCILSMVEKTRRALAILQQRSYDYNTSSSSAAAAVASTSWQKHQQIRRDETSELRRQASELIAQTIKATEDRVIQVKRKAEEAVHDVRRTAMAELQRALSAERLRAERLAAEARRQGAEETLLALGRHSQAKEVCWNCGRRAAETCSGCNIARYCSTFCQHKHWEVHHKICGRVSQLMMAATGGTTGPVEAHQDSTSNLLSHRSSESRSSKSPSPVSAGREGSAPFVH